MKTFLSISIVTILALGTAGVAEASLSFTANIGGVPNASGVTTENFNGASPSILTLNANSALRTGANYSVVYVPPYYSGSTAGFFGEAPANGLDSSQYVVITGGGSAKLSFSSPKNYFGLLWGSIDIQATLLHSTIT